MQFPSKRWQNWVVTEVKISNTNNKVMYFQGKKSYFCEFEKALSREIWLHFMGKIGVGPFSIA